MARVDGRARMIKAEEIARDGAFESWCHCCNVACNALLGTARHLWDEPPAKPIAHAHDPFDISAKYGLSSLISVVESFLPPPLTPDQITGGALTLSHRYEGREPGFYAPRKRTPRRPDPEARSWLQIGEKRMECFDVPLPARVKCATCGAINEVGMPPF